MRLKVKLLKFIAGKPIAILNSATASRISVHIGERVLISKFGDSIISIIDVSKELLRRDEIGVSQEIADIIKINEGDEVEVGLAERPESTHFIKQKMDGKALGKEEIKAIISDIVANALTEAEIAYFVAAVYKNNMSLKETEYLIESMVSTGNRIAFSGDVADKHSIGGIAANRTTPIIISICASAGLKMPKSSSRAITSAAGTADVIEAIASVEFSVEEIQKIVDKTGACLVWGGSLGLSPADDKLIQVERILNLDPDAQLLASVLSKKIAVGSKYVLIDIPFGKSAKVDRKRGLILKSKFESLGKKFGLKLKCALTDGNQPIGRGIGPLLEIRDIIQILKREDGPKDLEDKSVFLAGQIFELAGKSKKGEGEKLAREILNSGKAFEKFKQIIEAQRGKIPTIRELESRLGKFSKHIFADRNGTVKEVNNKKMNHLANIAGSPMDKGAGLFLHVHVSNKIKKGDKLITIYADSSARLDSTANLLEKIGPIVY
jgi:AMP phosphorylase